MDLSKDVIMSLWSFNFAMSYIIHKMLLFIKNNLNYLVIKIVFSNTFLKSILDFQIFLTIIFFIIYNNGKSTSWRRKHN